VRTKGNKIAALHDAYDLNQKHRNAQLLQEKHSKQDEYFRDFSRFSVISLWKQSHTLNPYHEN